MIVAIDGPAGAGKSTVAKRLAERLGFRYVDREIASARTTKDGSGGRPLSMDLLLANAEDRTPIVGEVKLGERA